MKKNEKNFVQNEADLENVAGGLGTEVETNVKTGDISGYRTDQANQTETTTTKEQNIKFGDVSGGISGVNFTNG